MNIIYTTRAFGEATEAKSRRPKILTILVLLLFMPLLAGVAAFVLTARSEPVHEATASLLVTFGREYIFRPFRGDEESWSPWRAEIAVNAEMEILNSAEMKEAAIAAVGAERITGAEESGEGAEPPSLFSQLASKVKRQVARLSPKRLARGASDTAMAVVRKDLAIEGVKDSNVIHVSFRHADSEVAVAVVDALVANYLKERQKLFSSPEAAVLEKQIGMKKAALQTVNDRLVAFQQKLGIADFGASIDGLSRRDEVIEAEIDRLSAEIAAAKSVVEKLESIIPAASTGEIEAAKSRVDELEGQLAFAYSNKFAVQTQQRNLLSQKGEYDLLQQERAAIEVAYEKILSTLDAIAIETGLANAGDSNVKIIQAANVPPDPVSLPATTLAGLAAGLAFLAGLTILVASSVLAVEPARRQAI